MKYNILAEVTNESKRTVVLEVEAKSEEEAKNKVEFVLNEWPSRAVTVGGVSRIQLKKYIPDPVHKINIIKVRTEIENN